MHNKNLLQTLGFSPKENSSGIYIKRYADEYSIEVDFEKELINYGERLKAESKTTQNFTQAENFVVLECVNRLLEKGYTPENIILEKTWPSGHGTSGRLDICVTREDGSEYLLIECKTYGKEFDKEFAKMQKDGGQLFTYFKFSNKPDVIMLYASELKAGKLIYRNEIVKIEEEYRAGDVKDFYDKWNKLTKDNGLFDAWVSPYNYISKALTPKSLKPIRQEDSGFIFNRFLEILRHNVVSDKPNAFNKIFTLFLCKIYDEKVSAEGDELKFQWLEGIDTDISFQMRLTDLYKNGMYEFLEKKVTDFSTDDFNTKYKNLDEHVKADLLKDIIKLRLEKNNEFAIKEVFDEKSFQENAKVVKQVVELLQGFKIRYTKKQQYLSDFFELLLTTGLKQESGQFFTPVPIAQFIIKSIPIEDMIDTKLKNGERNNLLPYVIDYAAGSGHFITETMHEMQRILDKKAPSQYISDTAKKIKNWQEDHFDWALQYVYGIEKDYRLVKVGKVGCYLHGDGLANVIHSDGLGNFKNTLEYKDKLSITDVDFPKENKQFDLVASNPPYSVSAFKQNARSYYTEEDFDLYNNLTDNSSEIECLFIERTKQLLKDGGIAGLILPSSILSNTGIYSRTREIILQYFEIIAIAELGSNTFMATGTNTVTLFMRRRNNYDSINLRKSVERFFANLQDVTLNGVEKPVAKYVAHTWEGISIDDYKTLLQKAPNELVQQHEIYQEYQKKIKAKNEAEKWNEILRIETEKLFYFILVYPQQVVLVKSGEKDAEKRFLGYEFSNRRGSEGIHPLQRGKSIDECTQLFDPETFDNPEKASTYIYQAFKGDFNSPIHEGMQANVSRTRLLDMLTFDRVDFEKNISLNAKKKVIIETKYSLEKIENLFVEIKNGKNVNQSDEIGKYRVSRIESIADATFNIDATKWTNDSVSENDFLQRGDILLSHINSVEHLGKTAFFDLEEKIIHGVNLLRFRPDISKVIPKYVSQIFKQRDIILEMQKYAIKAANQASLNSSNIKNLRIPLPPKEIQAQIVAEIEVLEEKEKVVVSEIDGLKANISSIIQASNGKKVKLQDITTKIGSGATPHGGQGVYKQSGISFIRSQNIYDSYFLDKGLAFIDEAQAKKLNNVAVEKDDILFNITGASVARCCMIEERLLPARVNQHVSIIRTNDKAISKYVQLVLVSSQYKNELLEIGDGATSREAITKSQLENFEIPLPSISEQQKIVSEIEKLESRILALETELKAIPQQKEAILKKYL